MRVAADELAAQVARVGSDHLPKIILINGREPLLIEEALDQLRESLRGLGYDERIKYQVEPGFDWRQVTGIGQTMSLFSAHRLIELRVPKTLGTQGTKALGEFCNNPPAADILVVIMPALDKRQRQAKWAMLVESCGWVADCHDISAQQFPRWIKQRLQSRALRVESGVVEMLAERLEGNVLAAAQEIDKLQGLCENRAVTIKLLAESLADQARFDVYALTDGCLAGDFSRVLRIKQRLQSEGIEPVIVVWALAREIRLLAAISAAASTGQNRSAVFKQHRVWSAREAAVNLAVDRLGSEACYQLLEQVAHLDQSVKGQRLEAVGSVWYQIELLCAAICGIDVVKQA